ncbi:MULTISPECIES: ABC transporter permease [Rahnella]|uniref:Pyoverdine export ATP-binding/permease protein PvdT n=1 Tax=Rahnella laticis TaxID=2787622 RepID=A0ABS0DZU7_9GAMM|nr:MULTISPECIES: ABC transporter permease [Rahnella]MBF7978373.1 ABC transporter permease [Rahnella laticis]MBF7997910.1 ABC transporter permease [Rahnella sp. LAC-M12]
MNNAPIIELTGITRTFYSGEQSLSVLKEVSLTINKGEMVAIVGPSGSGKSTLMNIMGCLDQPSAGAVRIAGVNTCHATGNQLATLRSQHIGFIFQRYHLMPYLSACDNVTVPARYTAMMKDAQKTRAKLLLTRLGLADKIDNRPEQLSGGQQQRVSVARALMNGANIILADEPTGALDAASGNELMDILHGLHQAGHTIILVTHDALIASQSERIITLNDGEIISDRSNTPSHDKQKGVTLPQVSNTGRPEWIQSLQDTVSMALQALRGHRIRTLLSMLGIIIGVVSVMMSMAIGEGTKEQILKNISQLGARTISIKPGLGWENPRQDMAFSLSSRDVELLARQPYGDRVTPVYNATLGAQINGKDVAFTLNGVADSFFAIHRMRVTEGRYFNQADIDERSAQLIIDRKTANTLFPMKADPVGEIIQFSGVPFVIIGITDYLGLHISGDGPQGWIPYTTFQDRLQGQTSLSAIELQVREGVSVEGVQNIVEELLDIAHGRRDFYLQTDEMMVSTIKKTSESLTMLIAAIAGISLIVGGIGVMNIMLVSITERTFEIGIRLAIGAREKDILNQFLIESVVICLLGSVAGVLLALSAGSLLSLFIDDFNLKFTLSPIFFSCGSSVFIGLVFGYFPALNAARLNPTEALKRE